METACISVLPGRVPKLPLKLRAARSGYRYDVDLSSFLDFMKPQMQNPPENEVAIWELSLDP